MSKVESIKRNIETPQAIILDCVVKLDHLRERIAFISNGVIQSSDWIDEAAASSLAATVNSIWDDLGATIKDLDGARQAL